MKSRDWLLGSAFLVVAVAGCTHSEGGRTAPFESQTTGGSECLAPAGRRVLVRLEKGLGTDATGAGSLFDARLAAPLVGEDGREIAPAGAVVRGTVVTITMRPPSMTLRFDSIHTGPGDAPLDAAVLAVRGSTDFGVKERSAAPSAGRFSTLMRKGDIGTLETPVDTAPMDTSREELRIPAGTVLDLALTSPLKVVLR